MNATKISLTALVVSAFLFAPPALSQGRIESFGSQLWLGTPPTGTGFTQVDAGEHFNTAIHADGTLWVWGSDDQGQISSKPTGNDFTMVSAGSGHALALRTDGTIEAWGRDANGQVSGAPAGNNFVQVSAGHEFSAALDADGYVTVWGQDGSEGVVSEAPTDSGYNQIAAGRFHVVAIRDDGTLSTWGLSKSFPSPPLGNDFVQISAGYGICMALKADGSVETWGNNTSLAVTNSPAGTGYLSVEASYLTCYVQKANGLLHGWGSNPVVPGYGVNWIGMSGASTHVTLLWELDCNYDGTADYAEIANGDAQDCNGNEVPDSCDIKSGFSYDIDGNDIPDECMPPALWGNVYEISVSAGGVQDLFLTAPNATDVYILLGSTSGTTPGITAGAFTLPLNLDSYLLHTLESPNAPPLSGSFGTLTNSGSGGTANAAFTLPPGLDAGLIGLTVHHAFATIDVPTGAITFISNAAPLELVL